MQQLRIGFIGTGKNARRHIKAMAKIDGVEVAALADPSQDSLDQARRIAPSAATYDDYTAMLDAGGLDGVVICTPHTLHYEQVMACLDRGLHVQVEKPLACTSAHAREIMSKQAETGKIVLIGYQRHYEPHFRWVRQQVQSGALGPITFVQCFQGQNWLNGSAGTWRQKPEWSGGGQLNDSGSHLIDILLWLTDLQAEEVTAYVDHRGAPVDINSAVSVRFTNGAIGNISVLGDQVAKGMWEDITIAGEKGVVWIRQGGRVYFSKSGDARPSEVEEFGDGAGSKDQNFIDAIRGTQENQVPPVCGLRVIELTEAVWRAARQGGKPVPVEKG